jgi:hypothetical protein
MKSFYRVDQKKSSTASLFSLLLSAICLPGLSRCGVPDGVAPQRGFARIDV